MRNWLGVIKGIVAVVMVSAVVMVLFLQGSVPTGSRDEYIDRTNAEDQSSSQEDERETGHVIEETYTASPMIGETDCTDVEGSKEVLRQELTLSEGELIQRGKVIYLTFDDGPGKFTAGLLDILGKYNVKATFFVSAGIPDYLNQITRMKEEGHTVGIHCFEHNYQKIYASEKAYMTDLQMIDDLILELTGQRAELVRFPGGSSNTVSRFNPGIMTRLAALVEEKGWRYFDWNVLSGDAGETTDTNQVIQNIKDGILKKDISVVLQHDIYDYSIAAVEEVIIWGLQNGYAFLPLTMESPTIHHPIAN